MISIIQTNSSPSTQQTQGKSVTLTHVSNQFGTLTWNLPEEFDESRLTHSVKTKVEESISRVLGQLIVVLCIDETAALRLIDTMQPGLHAIDMNQILELQRIRAERRALKS